MRQEDWPWVFVGLAATVVLPLLVEWTRRRPPRSGNRFIGWAHVVWVSGLIVAGVLALNGAPLTWLVGWMFGATLIAAVPMTIGQWRLRKAHRRDAERHLRPDQLALGVARLWVRPRQRDGEPPRGIGGRVDRWLATDGPAPTAGWWHNGGLIVDDDGPALVDAAGLRHGLPAGTAALLLVPAPKSVLLVDDHDALLARLPTTGFDEPDLQRFATVAGWRYDTGASPGRTAPEAVDLRSAVVDKAARDRRSPTRTGRVLRRDQ